MSITTSDSKFMSFWATLGQSLDLGKEHQPIFLQALQTAGYYTPTVATTVVTSGAATVGTKTKKRPTGYNLFTKQKTEELKANGTESSERMKIINAAWKACEQSEKDEWKAKAAALPLPEAVTTTVAATTTPKVTKAKTDSAPRAMTGYQLFVKENMESVKNNTSIPAKERMKELGNLWKEVDQSTKDDYKARASTMLTGKDNATVVSTTTAPSTAVVASTETNEEVAEGDDEGEVEEETE